MPPLIGVLTPLHVGLRVPGLGTVGVPLRSEGPAYAPCTIGKVMLPTASRAFYVLRF
jgi:hypothetical protein